MKTTRSNSYVMSRDFLDDVPRMRGRDIQERICFSEAGWKALLNIHTKQDAEVRRAFRPITCHGDTWLTELHVYVLLHDLRVPKRAEFNAHMRSALFEFIWAFVAYRRLGPQLPVIIDGAEVYPCDTPEEVDMQRKADGGMTEMAAILAMLDTCFLGGDDYIEPVDGLQSIIGTYSGLPLRVSDPNDVV